MQVSRGSRGVEVWHRFAKPDIGRWVWALGQLAGTVRNRLRRIQHRPGLISGFLAQPGLTLEPESPWRPDLGLSTSVVLRLRLTVPDQPGHSPNVIEPSMCPRRITGCRLSSLQKERFKRHRDCWQLSAMPVKHGAG